jgi:DNA-directed RNA polymerase specialized sigma24 family protein
MASASARRPKRVAELVAREALSLRPVLIHVHGHAASREDLEDLFSQAILELLTRARRDPTLTTPAHVRNALRQKFASRLLDHRRALAGRSAAAAASARACPLELVADLLPGGRDTVGEVLVREQIREVTHAIRHLTPDQRTVLLSQMGGEPAGECCHRTGWTVEKYRKVAQRARARLRGLPAAVA